MIIIHLKYALYQYPGERYLEFAVVFIFSSSLCRLNVNVCKHVLYHHLSEISVGFNHVLCPSDDYLRCSGLQFPQWKLITCNLHLWFTLVRFRELNCLGNWGGKPGQEGWSTATKIWGPIFFIACQKFRGPPGEKSKTQSHVKKQKTKKKKTNRHKQSPRHRAVTCGSRFWPRILHPGPSSRCCQG